MKVYCRFFEIQSYAYWCNVTL